MCFLTRRLSIVLTDYLESWNNAEIDNDKTSFSLHVVKWLVPVRTCLCTTQSSRLNTHQSSSHHNVYEVRGPCRIWECWNNCHSWCNATFPKLHICAALQRVSCESHLELYHYILFGQLLILHYGSTLRICSSTYYLISII